MDKTARTDHPIHELLARRWSPRAFEPKPVPAGELRALLEAARWAPSSFNEQPWSFLVAARDAGEDWDRLLSCVNEFNRSWAGQAGALLVTVARTTFARNGEPNDLARHDIGLAVANLSVEATHRGLAVHQMAGILPDRIREVCRIPDEHVPVTAVAVGYPGSPDSLPESLREAENTQRSRKPQSEFVYSATWGEPPAFCSPASAAPRATS